MTISTKRKKPTAVSLALDVHMKQAAPTTVVKWIQSHLRLPDSDMKRLNKLYNKFMDEAITSKEKQELDHLLDECAALDLLRARLLFSSR
jgi:predicted metalloendopeptidase